MPTRTRRFRRTRKQPPTLTLLARGDTIPNYHWPTDTYENVEPTIVARAVETGRELLRAIDAEAA